MITFFSFLDFAITVPSLWAHWRLKSTASWPFRCRSKKPSMLRVVCWPLRVCVCVVGVCVCVCVCGGGGGGGRGGGEDPSHKGPVTWKMFPFDDVIMIKITTMKRIQLLTIRLATHTCMTIVTENDFIGFQHTAWYAHFKIWVKYTPGLNHFESYFWKQLSLWTQFHALHV